MILAVALAIPSFAQFDSNRSRSRYNHNDTERYFGIRLGLNISTLNSSMADMDMDSRTGLALGAVYGMQLANSAPIWLEGGLLYSEKGGKTHVLGEKVECRMKYLQVPIVIKYSFEAGDDFYVQPFLGGYMALGVGGRTKYYADKTSSDSFSDINRFDAGLRVGCGVEYSMVYAEAGFDFGLTNIAKDDFERVRNQAFFVNVGVNF